jgi:hypothetical protein
LLKVFRRALSALKVVDVLVTFIGSLDSGP